MTALRRPQQLAALVVRGVDRAAATLGRLGPGAFGFPLAIAMGLGAGLFALWDPDFLGSVLARRATMQWMGPVLAAIGLFLVAATGTALLVARVRRRRSGAPLLEGYLHALKSSAFLAALPLVFALHEPLMPRREWLALSFIGIAVTLVVYSAYQARRDVTAAAVDRPSVEYAVIVAVVCAAGAFAWRLAALGIANHLAFNTGRSDLGIYVNRFREASEGRLFGCSLCAGGKSPYVHIEPIVALLSPIYRLHPSAQTIIVLAALAIGSGAVAVFFLARRFVPLFPAAALGLAYIAYPPIESVGLIDFHAVAFAIPICLWLLFALETGRFRTYFALAVLLLLVREDMGFVLASVGVYVLATSGSERARVGWATLGLAVLSLVVMQVVAPGGVTGVFDEVTAGSARRLIRSSDAPAFDIVQRVFTEGKALHLVELLSPLLFVPLLISGRILLAYGGLLVLSSTVALPDGPHADEVALVVPFLFALTARGIGQVFSGQLTRGTLSVRALGSALSLGILVCSALECYGMGSLVRAAPDRPGPRTFEREPTKAQVGLDAWLRKLSVSWPKGTRVAASSVLLPHLGGASYLYALDDRSRTDYVVAYMRQRQVARRMEAEVSAGQLIQVDKLGDVRVYRPNYRTPLSPRLRHLDDE